MSVKVERTDSSEDSEPSISSYSSDDLVHAKLSLLEESLKNLVELNNEQSRVIKHLSSHFLNLKSKTDESGIQRSKSDTELDCQIYMGNVSPKTTIDELIEYFVQFEKVREIFFANHFPRSKNGFVTFDSPLGPIKTLAKYPHYVGNRNIIVNKCNGKRGSSGKENVLKNQKIQQSYKPRRYTPY